MMKACNSSYSVTIRLEFENSIGMFALIANAISLQGGDLGSVDIVRVQKGKIVRDITVNCCDETHEDSIVKSVQALSGVNILRVMDRTFTAHEGGKIQIRSRMPIRDSNELAKVYTPGVARICRDINKNPAHAYRYTIKGNSIAIITDGTAVLGLGDIGPEAAMPVMEGKAMILREFAGIDAFPMALNTKNPDDIIRAIKSLAPAFGGINLEDISAPRCFEIETKLRKAMNIPVIHDDQHGTAVVILAALINVGRLFRKNIRKMKVVISGAGAAGAAAALMLNSYGFRDIIVCDSRGAIYQRRKGLDPNKRKLAALTNPRRVKGGLSEALTGAHIFIGVSAPDILSEKMIKGMAKGPVVFALANPDPEIAPELAMPIARVFATGRSDFPNQINNMLSFPGIFRGLLDAMATGVNEEIKVAAAEAIANIIHDNELHEEYIIPSPFDRTVVTAVASAVKDAAKKTGLSQGTR